MRRFVLGLIVSMLMALSASAQPLIILCENDPPAQFRDVEGNLTGYTVELVREIQKRVGNQDEIKMVPWARGYQAAQLEPNTALFVTMRTAERERLFKWVGPVVVAVTSFYALRGSGIRIERFEDVYGR